MQYESEAARPLRRNRSATAGIDKAALTLERWNLLQARELLFFAFVGLLRVGAAQQVRGRHSGGPDRRFQQLAEKLSNDTATLPLGAIVMCSVSLMMKLCAPPVA